MSEVEETMKRISAAKGVTGAIIIDKEGEIKLKNIFKLINKRHPNPIHAGQFDHGPVRRFDYAIDQ